LPDVVDAGEIYWSDHIIRELLGAAMFFEGHPL